MERSQPGEEGEAGTETLDVLGERITSKRGCVGSILVPPTNWKDQSPTVTRLAPSSAYVFHDETKMSPILVSSGGTTARPAEKEGLPCSSTDSDCPVCFHQYSPSRVPKCLACQHVFCAVCLKLLVQNEAHSWRITCPICREATPIFGGLIASLRTSDAALLGPLASLGPNGEEHLGPEAQRSEPPAHGISYIYQEDSSDGPNSSDENRGAARRLLFLLSLLMLLGLLVLPFVSRGLLKWALCSALGCGSVVCAMLCWNPQWRCSCSFPSWRKRASHSSPFA